MNIMEQTRLSVKTTDVSINVHYFLQYARPCYVKHQCQTEVILRFRIQHAMIHFSINCICNVESRTKQSAISIL